MIDTALPTDLCQPLISRFKSDSRVVPDPQPDYSTRQYLYLSDKSEWTKICQQVAAISHQLVDNYLDFVQSGLEDWFDDGYVMAHYRAGDSCTMHDDGQCPVPPNNGLRYLTLLYYLNDVETGGETHFPVQNTKITPKQGRAILFPAMLTHPHEVLTTKADRYILQTWITDPALFVHESSDQI